MQCVSLSSANQVESQRIATVRLNAKKLMPHLGLAEESVSAGEYTVTRAKLVKGRMLELSMSVFGDAPGMTPFKSRKAIQASPRQASAAARASYSNSPRKVKPASTGSSKTSAKASPQKAISKISPKPSSISPPLSLGMEAGEESGEGSGGCRRERLGRRHV